MAKTVTQHIRNYLQLPPRERPPYEELVRTEWYKEFEILMRNRLIMGALRYETFQEKFVADHNYDLIQSAIDRLQAYQESGNTEHLVDVANLCMIEFASPTNRKAHWSSVDDGIHVSKKHG